MPLYIYSVKDKTGKNIKGKMTQTNPSEVAHALKEMGYTILDISEQTADMFSVDIAEKFSRIKLIDKVTFYIKLSSMLRAGVPLVTAFESVLGQINNKKFHKIIEDIHRNILAGNSLSQSLLLYPKVFPELLINVIQSGEASGKLIEVLEEYAAFSENQAALRQKIISALIYPCILIIAGIGLMFIFITFLLPKFVVLFKKTNIPLPIPTQVLLGIGDFFGSNKISILIGIVIFIVLFKVFSNLYFGRRILDFIKLKLPYVGILIKKISIARFSRTLSTLYASGVPILRSLEICEKSTGNIIFSQSICTIKENVTKGKSFASIMAEIPLFPADATQLVAIGEKSGNLGFMLGKISDFYERDIDMAIKNLSSIIEPLVLLFVGIIIGFLAYSVIMPIFDMMKGL